MLGLLLLAIFLLARGASSLACGECVVEKCPQECHARVQDPCHCCHDGICAGLDGQPCSSTKPCGEELFCDRTINRGVCTCKQEKGPVCGFDGITYKSICDLNMKSRAGVKKKGLCDMPPTIVTAPSNKKLEIGQPLTLDCEIKGYPVPSIEWHFGSTQSQTKVLPGDDEMTAVQLRGGPENSMITSWLQIVSMRQSDEGLYTCIGRNVHGEIRAQALVLKHSKGYGK